MILFAISESFGDAVMTVAGLFLLQAIVVLCLARSIVLLCDVFAFALCRVIVQGIDLYPDASFDMRSN